MSRPNLDLAPIGNCSVSALIDRQGRFVWACAPRVDGDPVFSALMDGNDPQHGFWSIDLEDVKSVEQAYVRNTAGAAHRDDRRTRRFGRDHRFRPAPSEALAASIAPSPSRRMVRPLSGAPRITIRLRPAADWGGASGRADVGLQPYPLPRAPT